jgi:hypothetical protein
MRSSNIHGFVRVAWYGLVLTLMACLEPTAVLGQTENIELSRAHLDAVNQRRRIYVNNDAGYDAVAMGPKESPVTPDEWIAARFSAFTQPGSQVDCVGWCLDEGNIAAYPSQVIPELQYPTLLRWRKKGVDIAQRIVEESHHRKLEVFWEHRHELTTFVRQVRVMLQEVARKRGRPLLLSVRVAETIPGCHFDGIDIEAWVRQNLVDMIMIGTRSIEVDLRGFRRLTAGTHVKLYPCIDQHHSPDGYHAVPAPDFLRGVAANWWQQGADGIATFNFWNELPAAAKVIGSQGPMFDGQSTHAQLYLEIGDPKVLAPLDKWFVVSRRYGGGFYDRQGNRWNDYLNLNHQAPLPLTLTADPAWVEVSVADDLSAQSRTVDRLELRLEISGEPAHGQLGVKFNGVRLQDPQISDRWWVFTLTPGKLAAGRNLVTVDGGKFDERRNPITLEKVEVHVTYRSGQK